jgi:hypothetical protein
MRPLPRYYLSEFRLIVRRWINNLWEIYSGVSSHWVSRASHQFIVR